MSIKSVGALIILLALTNAFADTQYSERGADTCLMCHRDTVTLAVFEGAHGRPDNTRSPFGPGQLQCEACHGPAGRHSKRGDRDDTHPDVVRFGKTEPSPASERDAVCIECHADTAAASWHGSAHDLAEVACADCHISHAGQSSLNGLDASATEARPAELCLDCHPQQRTAGAMAFTHSSAEGSPACADCHSPHGSSGDFQLVRNSVNETCYTCHADKRGPVLWEHAPVTEDCSICHDSHGSNHAGMLTQRGPYLCQACHTQAGHPSVAYDGGGLPSGPNPSISLVGSNCVNCHTQVHGSNHPSGAKFMR